MKSLTLDDLAFLAGVILTLLGIVLAFQQAPFLNFAIVFIGGIALLTRRSE